MNVIRDIGYYADQHAYELGLEDQKQAAIEKEYQRLLRERRPDLDYMEIAARDALSESTINDMPSRTRDEALQKAEAYADRARILTLISTGVDDAELGRTMRRAANDAFNRECYRCAERNVEEVGDP